MASLTNQNKPFNRYFKLLGRYCADMKALLVLDADGNLVWQSELLTTEKNRKIRDEINGARLDSVVSSRIRIGEHFFDFVDLPGSHKGNILTLCIEIHDLRGDCPSVFEIEEVQLLNEGLLESYQQGLELMSQEDELIHMTDELTRRYEELNLIYKSDDQANNTLHGRELLAQIIGNTPSIMNVDLALLAMPDKKIQIMKFNNDQSLADSIPLISFLSEPVFKHLKNTGTSMVINHREEATSNKLNLGLPYKMVVCPLVNGLAEIVGLLVVVRKNKLPDFENSDRNLLDVMAKKASKIVQFNYDPLTGLENSRSFELVLDEALNQAGNLKTSHSLVNIDIDGMAVINDILGREAGDQLIKAVGTKISNMLRTHDSTARLGGDKFGVFLRDCDLFQAQQVMRKIADQVSTIKYKRQKKLYEISISVGIAPINGSMESTTSIMNAAESARQRGKKLGPNRITVYEVDATDLIDMKEHIQWLGLIQAALKDNGYQLYSQAIQPLDTDKDAPHFEILLRMKGEEGILTPNTFLPAAENFQLMPKIDRWVIDRALQTLSEFSEGLDESVCQISINLSGQSLSDPEALGDFIKDRFKQYQINPSAICFEITETSAIANLKSALRFINDMRSLGCQFSLDDFGTGLSSFAYLKQMKVDYLKIDGSFVHNIIEDRVSESMVAAISQVGHAMGIKTVAEFVETVEIRDRLVEIGVDFAQGYWYGKPVPFTDQLQIIRNQRK